MSRGRLRRKSEKWQRHWQLTSSAQEAAERVREAARVERLAYTRTQAAEALGVSRSTFNRRVLPYIETVEMPWGTRLIPVDELERLLAEQRRSGRSRPDPSPPGRRPAVSADVVSRIRAERSSNKSLAKIAHDLTSDGVPTGHGGVRWWPSTVRAVLARSSAAPSSSTEENPRSRDASGPSA
jgi:hypothetical protein